MADIEIILNNQTVNGEVEIKNNYFQAAFLIAAGILAAEKEIIINGLNVPFSQKFVKIINILKSLGADIKCIEDKVIVKKSKLKSAEIDVKNIPELTPLLIVLASQAKGKTILKNYREAKNSLEKLKTLKINLKKKGNKLEICGPTKLKGAALNISGNPEVMMAAIIASLVAEGKTIIANPVCIKNIYFGFFDDLRKIGVDIIPLTSPFGKRIKLSIYGDSHGRKIGLMLEGVNGGISISTAGIQKEVDKRKSISNLSTARQEEDKIIVINGIEKGITTGSIIKIEIKNNDTHSKSYEDIKIIPRPGHADFTARTKYGSVFDFRGGGFSSGRLTACMVAAGAIAKQILKRKGIDVFAYTKQIGEIKIEKEMDLKSIKEGTYKNLVRCPDEKTAQKMAERILKAKEKGDSIGGVVECIISGAPVGLGEPLFDSAESMLSHAMFSIPAVKAIEFGSGFEGAQLAGSQNNDEFIIQNGKIKTATNNSGGILGGLTNSMPIIFRIAVKPTSSIGIEQKSINLITKSAAKIKVSGRHDPCIAIRVPPIVEAMSALTILDLYMREKE